MLSLIFDLRVNNEHFVQSTQTNAIIGYWAIRVKDK